MVACYGQVIGAIAELSARVRVISIRVPTEVGQMRSVCHGREFLVLEDIRMHARAESDSAIPVVKDAEKQGPIPSAWRSTLKKIIEAFVLKDYRISTGIPGVAPVSAATAEQIQNYIEEYGATLIDLPESTWNSSVCIWVGDH